MTTLDLSDPNLNRAATLVDRILNEDSSSSMGRKNIESWAKDPVFKYFPGLIERVGREKQAMRQDVAKLHELIKTMYRTTDRR